MPVLLNDLNKDTKPAVSIKTYSPKFFDEVLTGSGKKIGLINESRNPIHISKKLQTQDMHVNMKKRKYKNGNTETQFIPFYALNKEAWMKIKDLPKDISHLPKVGENSHGNIHFYMDMVPHSLILETISNVYGDKGGKEKQVTVCYQTFLYVVNKDNQKSFRQIESIYNIPQVDNPFITTFTVNPLSYFTDMFNKLNKYGYTMNDKAMYTFIQEYDLYDGLCEKSKVWQETIQNELTLLFENLEKYNNQGADELNNVSTILHAIEDYNIPLDLYRDIYASIVKYFPTDVATILCKQNLNLLLSDTLNNLDKNKAQLNTFTPNKNANIDPMFSDEQRAAIMTNEPLVMVQSVAGSGKSSVVLARIKYMVDAGIDPKDITVLSFTNAAANNIMSKNPGVNAYTIAKMIHEIYSLNYPTHELSTIDTVMNSLDIYYPDDEFAKQFKSRLFSIIKNDTDSFTRMNNFIEKHFNKTIEVLDFIKQTTLELEIIICYQKIEHLKEPKEIQSKFLIIDEVQDNSVFEFIYAIKYCDKNKESLFIVGDSSQCLYEFRASNPKALNVLEGSGVFATYKLQTNYRSNQEILDFANVALADIEANQYANLQLRANSLTPVTSKSFQEKVNIEYTQLNKMKDMEETLPVLIKHEIKDYLDDCIKRGEKVAFLAFTRRHVAIMEKAINELYPNKQVISLVPNKMFNGTIFSAFIKKYWDEVQFIPPNSIMPIIAQTIYARLDFLTYDKNRSLPHVQKLISKWFNEEKFHIDAWQAQYMNGTMTLDDFLHNVKTNMLHFEIRNNAIKQSLLSARNEEIKKTQLTQDADFIVSTIHSAKGLEFDNVVTIYQNSNELKEDKKRMYYVAFTRAMNSEYILAFDTLVSPKILADYEAIVQNLEEKERYQAVTPSEDDKQTDGD